MMKITEQTATTIVARRGSWIQLIIGLVLVIAGVVLLAGQFMANSHWFALGLFAVGALMIAFASWTTIWLDKSAQIVTIQKRYIAWRSSDIQFAFSDLREIVVAEQRVHNSNDSQQEQFKYLLIFQFQNGQQHVLDITPLTTISIGDVSMARFQKNNQVTQLGKTIADFVGVPFRDQRAPTIGEAMQIVTDLFNGVKNKANQ
jgi:energy-coupling factor transporter transmembrane protein EcfT